MAKPNPICSVSNCDKVAINGRGWCSRHYNRWYRHGDPLGGAPDKTPAGTLLAFIHDVALPWVSGECLLWPFTGNNMGYGQVRYKGRRRIASNLVCELAHGPAPEPDMDAAHSCGKGHLGCINPTHLSWETRMQNNLDKGFHGTQTMGSDYPQAKLTDADVREILNSDPTTSGASLARKYGVSNVLISLIRRRLAWKHVA